MKTRVHLTIDTEFSIAGAFGDPVDSRPVGPPAVYCRIGERSEGLGFLLETLACHGQRATFFVEALNTRYFGDEPMGEIANRLRAAGHDVQLHLHPCWTYFQHDDWVHRLPVDPPNDDVTCRSEEELARLIDTGRAAFGRWGLPAPTVLRTGGLRANLAVYRAMRRCGMALASNLGLAVFWPREPALRLYAGRHAVEGVTEVPVTTFADLNLPGRPHYKTLTITGCSWPEIRCVLEGARAAGLSDVVVLTHPFEYVKHRDRTYEKLYPDRINRGRLERLCAFLAAAPDFEAATLGSVAEPSPSDGRNPLLRVPLAYAVGRMLVNRINHTFMRF